MMSDQVTDERRLPFYTIDDVFLKRFGKMIGPNGIAVYNALCMRANKKTGESWPSRESIHEVTGLSVRAISASINLLAQYGLITIERTTGGPNHYFIQPVPEATAPLQQMQAPTLAPHARGIARHASPLAPDAIPLAPRAAEQESRTRIKNKNQEQGVAATAAPPPPSKPVPFEAIQAAPPEARKPNPQQAEVGAWSAVMELDVHIPANAKRVGNMLTGLRKSKDCQPTADVATWRFGRTPPPDGSWNFYTHTWQGAKGQPPTEREINAYWGAWLRPALKVMPNGGDQPRAAPPSRTERNRQLLEEALRDATGQPPISGPVIEGRVIHGRAS